MQAEGHGEWRQVRKHVRHGNDGRSGCQHRRHGSRFTGGNRLEQSRRHALQHTSYHTTRRHNVHCCRGRGC